MLSGKCCLSDRDYLRVQHPIEKGARPSRAAAAAVLALSLLSSDLSFISLISLSHSSLPVLTSTASQLLSSYFFFFFPPVTNLLGKEQRNAAERNGTACRHKGGPVQSECLGRGNSHLLKAGSIIALHYVYSTALLWQLVSNYQRCVQKNKVMLQVGRKKSRIEECALPTPMPPPRQLIVERKRTRIRVFSSYLLVSAWKGREEKIQELSSSLSSISSDLFSYHISQKGGGS